MRFEDEIHVDPVVWLSVQTIIRKGVADVEDVTVEVLVGVG